MQMHLSDFDKHIYNEYLKAQRKGKPYTLRKNFDNIDDETQVCLKQLSEFFTSFPDIRINDFFNAGFKDTDFQSITFFKSMRAIKMYHAYIGSKLNKADDVWVIDFIKSSLLYVHKFCKQNNLTVDQYLDAESPAGVPWFAIHLKNFNVCVYLLLAFFDFENKIMKHSDAMVMILGDEFFKDIAHHRTMFVTSNKCKQLARNGLDILKQQTKYPTTQTN